MKNFRKVLALVLVMATLFSFTAMAGAAYKDAASVSYKEAVDVLSAVGILNGYEDETFKPTNTISREEMAKMIAVLANSGSDVSKLYATAAKFADVPAERWSASYVAYCAKTGIVAGRSASTFDPTGKVTGLETAKMLLVVLGFDADAQGYVGADWKVNVLRDAKVMGLLNNFAAGYNVDAAITREEAAQMMLNALEAPCVVGLLSNNTITLTNALVFGNADVIGATGYDLFDVVSYAKLKDALTAGKWSLYGNVVISDDLLADKLFGLVKLTDGQNDCYMRPGTGWVWVDAKGNEVVKTSYSDKAVWSSYNTNATEIAKKLGAYNLDKYTVTEYVNGGEGTVDGGKGVLVELYEIGTELRLVEIHTYFDVLEEVDTYHKTVTIGGQVFDNVAGFKTADVDSYVLYWVCNNGEELHAAELAKVAATATVTKAVKNNTTQESYFVAEKKYEYADDFDATIAGGLSIMGEIVEENDKAVAYGVGKKFDIYTDKYGFVMFYEAVQAKKDYKYAVVDEASANAYYEYYNKADDIDVWSYEVAMVNFEKNPAVGKAIAADVTVFDAVDNNVGHDTLVKYYIDAAGNVATDAEATIAQGWDCLEAADDYYAIDGKFLSVDTQILVRVQNPMTGKTEYKYFDGCEKIDAEYCVDYAAYFASGNYVTYLYVEATYAHGEGAAYIMGEGESVVYLTDGKKVVGYNTYEAMVDGKEAVIATDAQIITVFNTVYDLELVRIGLTTDDKAPVYIVVSNTANVIAAAEMETLSVDKYGKLFYGTEWTGKKVDAKADFVLFTGDWDDDAEYVIVDAAELAEYVTEWAHFDVWAFDTDGDKDIDLLYVNAGDGLGCH